MPNRKGYDDTKRLGVIGGLGPIATAYFYELLIKMADARRDQEHLEVVIFSKPSIPDRTDYILGRGNDNPLQPMIDIGRTLVGMGADYVAIPCITAHYFHDALQEGISTPIIHIIKETVDYLKSEGICKVGIMATEGTIYSRLFQAELEAFGMQSIVPSVERQQDVNDLIYKNVKANLPVEMERFQAVSEELHREGAQVIILGCTELSLIKRDYEVGPGYIDAMEVLAMRSIQLCETKLKDEYTSLITR